MRSIIKTLTLTLALTIGVPMLLGTPVAVGKEAAVKVDRKKATEHFLKHQSYPASKVDLLAACKNLMDFSDSEKTWFSDHLTERTYNSADEVMTTLFKK